MADKKKISGLLKATALSIVLAAIVWFAGLVFNPPGLEMVLAIAAIVFSIISICLVVCCIAWKINSQISLYKVFAIVDIVLAVLAGGYAVYDIRTDTGWFAGLLQLKVVVVMDFLMNGWYNILYVDSLMCLF